MNGTVCAQGTEGTGLTISAPYGSVLNTALFASYGEPSGSCPDMSYNYGCHASASVAVVDGLCSGKTSCTIVPSAGLFEQDPCPYNPKWLAVVMSYSPLNISSTCEHRLNVMNEDGIGGVYMFRMTSLMCICL